MHPELSRPGLIHWSLAALIASGALSHTVQAAQWGELPLETIDQTHRVREGYVAEPARIARDADAASRGVLVGETAAHQSLQLQARAAAARQDDSRHLGGPHFHDERAGDTWVADLEVVLRDDVDDDGFFGTVDLSIDVDTSSIEREVYAIIDINEPDGRLTLSHTTRNFHIRGNSTADEYRIEIALLDNHRAAFRNLRIEIRDGWNNEPLDLISDASYASLRSLPLEAEGDDYRFDDDSRIHSKEEEFAVGILLSGSTTSGAHVQYDDHETYVAAYAGAAGPLGTLLLLMVFFARRHPFGSGRVSLIRLAARH